MERTFSIVAASAPISAKILAMRPMLASASRAISSYSYMSCMQHVQLGSRHGPLRPRAAFRFVPAMHRSRDQLK